MAPLTPRPSIRHDPITSSHLRLATFEKLDKDHLVNAYIRSQKLHAATYAADGKALVSSWDRRQTSGPVKHEDPRSHSHNYGFDTPVLKPRVAKQSDTVDVPQGIGYGKNGVVKNMQSKKPSRPVTKPEKEPSSKTKKEKKRLKPAIGKSKSISKKRSIQADSDDDGHAARLTERRERKRTKRAIVQPKEFVFSEDDDEDGNGFPLPGNTDKAKKCKKDELPAAFALMHGFTATNVGKNRLTLKPGRSAGVFGKGKASAKTPIVRNTSKKDSKHTVFSEFVFLNKPAKSEIKQSQVQSISSSSSKDSATSVPTPEPKRSIITNREPSKVRKPAQPRIGKDTDQATIKDVVAQDPSAVADKSKNAGAKSESELWDLELDDPDATRGSHSASSMAGDQLRDGTVVLNTRAIWGGAQIGLGANGANVNDDTEDLDAHCDLASAIRPDSRNHYSSSLCPSQSASQHGQPCAFRLQKLHATDPRPISKYFVSIEKRASSVAEGVEVPLHVASEELFSNVHNHAISPPARVMRAPPIVRSDQNLVTAVSNWYHPPKRLVTPPSSPDSIEMELQDYMDCKMANNVEGNLSQFDYYNYDVSEGQYDVFDAVYEGYDDEGEPSFEDPQGWSSGGLEHIDIYPGQQIDLSDLVGHPVLEVDPEDWNGIVAGNDMVGFEPLNEMQDIEDDSEYGSLHHDDHEDIQYDNTRLSHATAASVDDGDRSVLLTQRFSQGRAILLGFSEPGNPLENSSEQRVRTVSHAEVAVAKSLREHWLPQKF